MALDDLESEPGFLKGGFLGETSSGKTTTAMMLAIAVRRHFKLDGPISMFDTEGGSQYVKGWVRDLTGKPLKGKRARSFEKLMQWAQDCVAEGVSVGLVDSIAHPWEDLKESFLADVNAARAAKKWEPRALEFQDWAKIKPMWGKWTEFYLNSPLHLIVCGRAGDIYEKEINPETNRRELMKTGTRMQTEKNFGYEPSLLVEMSREQILEPTTHFVRRAVVWKDRFGMIDSKSCDFAVLGNREKEIAAVWGFFKPHVERLVPGSDTTIDTTKTNTGADEGGNDEAARYRRTKTIILEEIAAEFKTRFGTGAKDVKAKFELMERVFGTKSETAIEGMDVERLEAGLGRLRDILNAQPGLV